MPIQPKSVLRFLCSGVHPLIWFLIFFSLCAPLTGLVSTQLVLFLLILKPLPIAIHASNTHFRRRFAPGS